MREWRFNARFVAALGFSVSVRPPAAFLVSAARLKPFAEATRRPAPGAVSLSFTTPVWLADREAIVNALDGSTRGFGRIAGGPAIVKGAASQAVGPTAALRSSP